MPLDAEKKTELAAPFQNPLECLQLPQRDDDNDGDEEVVTKTLKQGKASSAEQTPAKRNDTSSEGANQ